MGLRKRAWILGGSLLLLAGCGSAEMRTGTVEQELRTATVTPNNVQVYMGEGKQFTASVYRSRYVRFSWSVKEGNAGGTITSGGWYTAPWRAGVYHVVAQDAARGVYGEATVTVVAKPPIVQVWVAPPEVTLAPSQTRTFTSAVVNTSNKSVTWKVREGAAGGTITSAGVYRAPSTPGTYHVQAISNADPSKSDSATITVTGSSTTPPPSNDPPPPQPPPPPPPPVSGNPTNVRGEVGGQRWTLSGSPYRVTGNLTVASGSTLTIDPGVEVIFQGRYKLSSRGTFNAVGTPNQRILFTAADRNTGWNGIRLLSGPPAKIQWAVFEYANKAGNNDQDEGSWDGSCGGALYVGNSGPNGMALDYNIFRFNKVSKWGGAMNLIINNSQRPPAHTFTGNIFYSNAAVHDRMGEAMAGAVWLDHIASGTRFVGGAFINNSVADSMGGGAVGTFDSIGSLDKVVAAGNTPNLLYNSDPNARVTAVQTPYTPSQTAAAPTFSANGSTLNIACSTPNSTIFYTTDGSNPNYGSPIYTRPVPLISGTKIRAICQASQFYDSPVSVH